MTIFFEPKTSQFLSSDFTDKIPKGAVEITDEHHQDLLEKHGRGAVLQLDSKGFPTAVFAERTPESIAAEVKSLRRLAYLREADPLKNEADYDAIAAGNAPDYTVWIAKVQEIKERLPLPVIS